MIHVKVPDTRVCSIIPLSHYLFSVLPKNFSNPEELWVTCLQGLSDSWDLNLKDELMDIEELHFLITLWKTKQSYLLLQLGFYIQAPAAAAKSLQLCPTLCNPIEGSPPGSPVPGILQARTLQWVAISFSNAWKWKVKVKSLSRVWLLVTPWTAAYQAPPFMGFSRQEYWSGLPLPSLIQAPRFLKLGKHDWNLSSKVL